jgi:hypothetical protein
VKRHIFKFPLSTFLLFIYPHFTFSCFTFFHISFPRISFPRSTFSRILFCRITFPRISWNEKGWGEMVHGELYYGKLRYEEMVCVEMQIRRHVRFPVLSIRGLIWVIKMQIIYIFLMYFFSLIIFLVKVIMTGAKFSAKQKLDSQIKTTADSM